MVNVQMNKYGFKEGTDFEGLMPKTMELIGDENCTGVNENEPSVHLYDPTANGYDQMKVLSPYDIMMGEDDNAGQSEDGDNVNSDNDETLEDEGQSEDGDNVNSDNDGGSGN